MKSLNMRPRAYLMRAPGRIGISSATGNQHLLCRCGHYRRHRQYQGNPSFLTGGDAGTFRHRRERKSDAHQWGLPYLHPQMGRSQEWKPKINLTQRMIVLPRASALRLARLRCRTLETKMPKTIESLWRRYIASCAMKRAVRQDYRAAIEVIYRCIAEDLESERRRRLLSAPNLSHPDERAAHMSWRLINGRVESQTR